MALQAGYDKATYFQPDGAGAAQLLDVVAHSWKEMVDAIDVTHTGTGGVQALLAGVLRGDGMMKAVLNNVKNPMAAGTLLRAGTNGIALFHYGMPVPFSVPCLVKDIAHQAEVAGRIEWTVNVSLNYLAGGGSVYIRQA